MATKTRKKSVARVEKERKRKVSAKRRKMIKTIGMIVLAAAMILLIVFSLAAPPRVI